jgi:Glycosyltransferases involved in cell wall biogenesis
MTVRLVGVLAGLVLVAIGLVGRRRGRLGRRDTALWLGLGLVVGLLSIVPGAADLVASLLLLQNRLFAVLVVAVGALFGLFLRQRGRIRSLEQRFGDLVRNLAVRDFARGQDAAPSRPAVGIVIAAYNEEEAIGGVLRDLPREVEGYRVDPIVVVDGGSDDTEGVVRRAGYSVATHPVNRGQGDALRTGFTIALARGDDVVVTMDADGQHRPDELPALLRPILAGEADYVQGSRFLGRYDDAGGSRETGIRLFTRVVNLLSGAGVTDCTNGFRAIRAESLAKLRLEEDRFSAAEIIMEAAARGLRMVEVPVHIQRRSHGESKKPRRLGYPLGYLRVVLAVWLR